MSPRSYALVTGDFVRTGGMDAANYALAEYLSSAGHPTHLVAYRVAAELASSSNIVFHRVPKPAGAYSLSAPLLGAAGMNEAARVRRAGGRVVVNGGNCPIRAINWVHYLHAAYEPTSRATAWRVAKGRAMHSTSLITERIALRRASLVVANSERTRRDVIARIGVPAERVHTVYYGINPDVFRPATPESRAESRALLGIADDRPRVLFIGALGDRRKGFDVVYDAWRQLCAGASWDADLVVVGTGAELPAWKARAERDGLAARFSFLGFRRDVPAIMAACDALVAPTRYEAYGLGVHEALCCAVPVLVSSSAGVAERYPEALSDWLLEDPESADALASKLARWRETAALRRTDVVALAERLRARTWRDMARDIEGLCETEV